MSKQPLRTTSGLYMPETTENLYTLGLLHRPRQRPQRRPHSAANQAPQSENPAFEPPPGTYRDFASPQSETSTGITAYRNYRRQPDSASSVRKPTGSAAVTTKRQTLPTSHSPSYAYPNAFQTSFNWRAGRTVAGMLNSERPRTRRERTFIGSECAVCEEPLEHTLRGERVLQFSCGHVSHEACFYEYIKEFDSQYCPTCNAPLGLDTTRGGNVLDIEKLSSIVRSVTQSDSRSSQSAPGPWDGQPSNQHSRDYRSSDHRAGYRDSREQSQRESRDDQRERIERLGVGGQAHSRNESGAATVSTTDFADVHTDSARRHDYDVQSMETDLSNTRPTAMKNPIPPPIVTVRSEFPTLNRSRQQQSLTCLVTIEIPTGKWQPDPEDIKTPPPVPPLPQDDTYSSIKSPVSATNHSRAVSFEPRESLEDITEELRTRVDNWHGLEFSRFGKLRLHGTIHVGKDRQSWQELECYLFAEMLICVKEKKAAQGQFVDDSSKRKTTRCTLKGSILIKKHLKQVESSSDEPILTLNLLVNDLPSFHLQFQNHNQLEIWKRALLDVHNPEPPMRNHQDYEQEYSGPEEDDYAKAAKTGQRVSSVNSSQEVSRSVRNGPNDYPPSARNANESQIPPLIHVPIDLVVVIPISSSMQGLKISLLRDTLRFLVQNLGERDRMGLVTFGSSGGGVPLVGMTTKAWTGWNKILASIRPVGQKSLRADVVEGANVAMDLLMQRKAANPISTILLISDSSTSDAENVDFVVQRAEAAKVTIHSFGLGLTHKPDTMIDLSSRTKASYLYVKDWMMLRECVAGCLGSLQSISHQNVKLKLRLPEGSPAKFVKISGALQITKRATGKDADAALGDFRFGDKRDVLVQLAIAPDQGSQEHLPQDAWETIVSGLEALGGPLDSDDQRTLSVEEVPLLQADVTYGDILRDGTLTQLPRPSLLAITMLPGNHKSKQNGRPTTPPIPPHPSIVQRRMELLASDMLSRALTLVSRGQHERAHHLLHETRTILKGLAKGGLPPIPTSTARPPNPPNSANGASSPPHSSTPERQPSPHSETSTIGPGHGVDVSIMAALDGDIESSLEWISHPAVFSRDSRKAVLQSIGVISSQRGYTFRTPAEALWADRIPGIKRMTERAKDWRQAGDDGALTEE
ncbi:hypothetical protein EPUS_05125 [Endocarpon pusillum Z07020]|uniref:von Willebrand and RING finger domain protein n=1 Tax=Endocarpon pusillum (strain Z07020 / HMAS-L-300199) TaxID=1263415 RepID=U1GBI6_ENDPU|nr:uncharacterized protein EPUS_05125 [Endocarpon pusillum Z07020]ERF74917.1 hypothetical protein EPUS_05125 [Endocarpon pusillum Z07020]